MSAGLNLVCVFCRRVVPELIVNPDRVPTVGVCAECSESQPCGTCGEPAGWSGYCDAHHPGFTSMEALAIVNGRPFPLGSRWARTLNGEIYDTHRVAEPQQ